MKLYNYYDMSFKFLRSNSPSGDVVSSIHFFKKAILAVAFLIVCSAQSFAQLDTLHLLPPFGGGVGNNEQPGDMFLYLSTPSTSPVNYTITDASGNNVIQTGTVVNGSPVRYDDYGIASGVAVAHSDLNSVLSTNVGFKVVSDSPIYVNLRLRSIDGSQAGSLTSKGNNALGTVFRLGSIPNKQNDNNKGTTFGLVATEDNTTVNIDLTGSGVSLVGPSAPSTNSVITVTLDEGDCYVLRCDAEDDPDNLDGMIGGLVTSNKPIVVNTGSWCGEPSTSSGRDYGIDQIVGVEKIGTDYIFVRAQGGNDREKPLIVAHSDNTEIYVNASATPIATIDAGEWYDIDGSNYVSGVMSVYTSEPTFAYQLLAGNNAGNTAGMNFVPDLSCQVDSVISEIPDISKVGGNTFSGGVTITTFAGSDIYINGVLETSTPVTTTLLNGDSYDVYNLSGLTGDVTITSSTIAIVSFYGVSGVAGYAGYFSGFQRPSDVQIQPDATLSTPVEGCIYGLFAIQRTGDLTVPFSADVSFAGTATQGTDYEVYDASWNPIGTTINYAAGETTKFIIIDAYDDATTEGTETIEVTFSWLLCNELQTATRTVDLEEPTISVTCQNDTIIYTDPGTCTANFSFGFPTVESYCSNSISRTDGSGLNSGDTFPLGTTTIEWTATTSDGEATDVCSFNVTVVDNIAPAITCPTDITVNADPGACSANVTVPLATATDNCGVSILNDHDAYVQDFESFSNGDYIGVEASEWTTWSGATGGAEDAQIVTNQANSGSNSIYFSSASGGGGPQDVVLPFGGLITSDIFNFETSLYVESGSSAYFNFQGSETIGTSWALEVTFNTDGTYNLSSGGINGTYSQGQWIDLRFRMNLTSNNWEFFIDGVSQGTWSNGTNQVASVNFFPADANASFWIDDVSFSTDPAAGGGADASGTYPVGTTTVTYTAIDDGGNETTCTQDITVIDNQNPTISCTGDINVDLDENYEYIIPDFTSGASASDNCSGPSELVYSQDPTVGTSINSDQTVTIFATDESGNSGSCTFEITVNPVVDTDGDGVADLYDLDDDNDGIPDTEERECTTAEPSSLVEPSSTIQGGTHVSAVYTNDNGYWSSSTSSINPVRATRENNLFAFETGGVIYTTGVEHDRLIDTDADGDPDQIDTDGDGIGDVACSNSGWFAFQPSNIINNKVFLEGAEIDGNPSSTLGSTYISDPGNQPLNTLLYNGPHGLNLGTGIANIGGDWFFNVAGLDISKVGDGAPDMLLSQVAQTGGVSHTVTFFDASGNAIGNSVEVSAEGSGELNEVVGISNYDVYDPDGSTFQNATDKELRLASIELQEFGLNASNINDVSLMRVSLSSNADVAFIAHSFDSFGDVCQDIDTDNDGIPNHLDLDSDNDGIYDLVEAGHGASDLDNDGVIDGNASDFGENGLANSVETSTESGDINYSVQDSDSDGDIDSIELDSDGDFCFDVEEAGYSDPNGDGLLGDSPVTANGLGLVTSGVDGYTTPTASNSVDFDYTVVTPPEAPTLPDITEECSATVTAPTTNSCTGTVTGTTTDPTTYSSQGTYTITWTFTDASGNSTTAPQNVVIDDTTNPTISCPGNQTVSANASCEASLQDYTSLVTANDNCGIASITQSPVPGTTVSSVSTVTMTATDVAGNTETCTFDVTVEDNTDPVADCQDITVQLDASGNATIAGADLDNGSTDNCGIATYTASQTSFDCTDFPSETVSSSDGYDVDITVMPISINPIGSSCAFGYNYTVTLAYQINFSGSNIPANLYTLQGNINCDGGNIFFSLPNSGGTGVFTTSQAYTSQTNCATVTPADLACGGITIDIGGPGIPNTNVTLPNSNDITLTVEDNNGNTDVCTSQLTVEDNIAPSATCQDISVNLDASGQASITAADIDNGSSDNCGVVHMEISQTDFTCSDLGSNTVTLTVYDLSGNTGTCTATVTVNDTQTPSLTCPADQTISQDASCSATMPDYTGGVATDNCSVTVTQSPVAGSSLSAGVTTVTLTATDPAGNSTNCSFDVTVEDSTNPTISCPANQTVSANASCQVSLADYTSAATANDNCTVTVTQSPAIGATIGLGTTTVTLTATDGAGNTATCTFDVTVEDTTDPVIGSCQSDVSRSVDGSCEYSLEDFTAAITATDNCSSAGNITYSQSPSVGTVLSGDGTTQIVTLTATDEAGNSTDCTFTLTLEDTTAPTFSFCPATLTETVDASCEWTVPDYAAQAAAANVASDNCTADAGIIYTQSVASGTVLSGHGTTQVITLTATDAAGNSADCVGTITLQDTSNPTISCPADQTLSANASCEASLPDYTSAATASDNCSVTVTQSPIAGASLGLGTTTVTLTATDGAGNTATCTFDVTVEDTTNPTVTCPADQTISADASCQVNLPDYATGATASDNCSVTVSQSPVAGASLGLGTTTVTLTATDGAGNTATCTFDVTVEDTTNPTVICPADQTISATSGCDANLPDFTSLATANDNCDATPTLTQSPAVGAVVNGTSTVTITATDAAGNSSSCTFDVTVEDDTNPTISCPADQTVSANASCEATLADYTSLATASDNCDASPIVTQSPAAGATLSLGANTVTFTVTDAAGNTSSCTFDVVVEDTTDPTISCPADQTISATAACDASLPNYTGSATVNDNCDATPSVTQSPVAGTILGLGTTSVTLTVTDAAGNTANCTFDVTVEDTTNPTVSCPSDQTLSADASCQISLPDYASGATASDNCSVTVTQSPIAGASLGLGTTTVTLTATDGAGNTATCTFDVTVEDTTDPTVSCPADQTLSADASCQASLPDYATGATASDNCSVTVTQSPAAGATLSLGTTTVTLTATDAAGNTATCTFDVTVEDTTNPTVTCPADQTLSADASCQVNLPDYATGATASDNCSVTVTQSPIAGTSLGLGTTTVTLTATDGAGNTATCSFDVTVEDTTNPTISCPGNQNVSADSNCEFTMADYTSLATASDNCSVTVTQSPAAGATVSGTTTVTLTATDAAGNTATCTFDVVVTDNAAPVIGTCQSDVNRDLDGSCGYTLEDFTGAITATDNCTPDGNIVYTQSPAAGVTLTGVGSTHTITLTATDTNGNSSDCTFDITLEDNTAPAIACPADFNEATDASCEFSIPDYTGLATASDNCDAGVVVTQSPAVNTVISGEGTTQVITLTATDASGNSTDCSFTITLIDDIDPTITCPADFDVATDANCEFSIPDYTSLGTAADNCDGDVEITQTPAVGNVLSGEGTTQTITLTATDNAGNTSDCTFTITLIDDIDPTITCPGDQNEPVDVNCEFSIPDYTSLAVATDNCDAGVVVTQSPAAGNTLSGAGTTQTITLTATDNAGNTTTCTFDITLIDTIDPTITCPGDQTASADANCEFTMADYTGLGSATDNCDAAPVITQSPIAGDIVSGTTTVTLTATDASGNTATCTFDVVVTDNAAPVIATCQSDVNRDLDGSCEYSLEDFTGAITATDNCTPDGDIVYTQSPAAGDILTGVGSTHTITLTATDTNGNSSDCTFDITLEDNTAPAIACPADFDEATDASCEFDIPDYTGLATASDNCDAGVVVTQSPAVNTVISGEGTTQVITLTATDASGNSADCSFTITLIDDIDPTITCPADFDVATDVNCEFSIPDYTSLGTAADNCDSNPTVTQSPAVGNVLSGEGTTQTITLTATDNAGNTATCTFDITLIDDIDPQITCPGDQNEPVDVNCEFSIPDYTSLAVATDNCDAGVTVTQSPAAGNTLSGAGTTQNITLTATDNAGNTTNCTFDITLIDTIDPVITCPGDQTASADANCEFTMADYTGLGSASDNCDAAPVITQFPLAGDIVSGTTEVTLTATDASGNTATCTFDVVVTDNAAPVIATCQSDVNRDLDGSCEYSLEDFTGAITATDNCTPDGNIVYTQSPVAGDVLTGVGSTHTITLTATDTNGNSSDCTFDITLEDNTAPAIACPADFNEATDASCEFSIPDYTGLATASDNCDSGVAVTQSPAVNTVISGEGTTQVITLTATDASGNSTDCSFTITLIDDIDPTITCPADFDVATDANCEYSIPDYTSLGTAADNCDADVTITQSPAVGNVLSGEGTTQTITLTATDNAGNTNTCSFVITLIDDIDPQITCPGDQNEPVDVSCEFSIPDYTSLATATDNCDAGVTVTQSPAAGNPLSGAGTTQTITLTATDNAGNTTTCTFDITLIDTIDPVITCPGDQTASADANCEFTMADYTGLGAATDNCDAAPVITQSPAAGDIVSGTTVVTLTATDASGNTATCTFDVVVTDNAAPVIATCQSDVNRDLDGSCEYSLEDFTGAITATDNCTPDANIVYTQSPAAGDVLTGVGSTHTITLTATDTNGNSSDCTFDITLEDNTAPAIACPADFNESTDASCEFSIPDYTGLATASDNCDSGVAVTQSPAVNTVISGEGTTQVITLTATDASGNSTDCSFTITLIDDIDPTITCPADFDVATDANCEYSIPDYTSLGTATDNCDADVAITQSPAVGNVLSGEGTTQTITLTATDNAGNTSDCTFTITLIDDIDPQITCPGDQNEPVDATCEFSIPDYTSLATATDNCDAGVTVTQSPAAGITLSGAGTTQTITLTATDNAGNTTTCTFDITLIDTIDPVITCPGDQTASADANCEFTMADYTGLGSASDNCDAAPVITQFPLAGDIVSGTTEVTLTATDAAGNTATCTFDVVVTDNAAPVISTCQNDVSRDLDGSCEYTLEDFTGAITATDNCTPDGNIVYTQSPAAGVTLTGVGSTHTITLTATDSNGNSNDCTFDITLEDNTAPAIACPADFNEAADASCEFSIPDYTGLATASDNCDAGVVVTQAPALGTTISGEGTTQVITLTATDASGNSTDCSFTITLIDDIDPTITCPADFDVATDANCEFSIPDYTSLGTAADNCDGDVEITQTPAVGNVLSGEGTTQTITLTATDNAGNTSDCTFTITLIDDIDPTITCPGDQNEPVDVNCEFSIPDYTSLAVATDNCDAGVTVTQSPAAGNTLSGAGTTQTITLTATDNTGNTTTCTFEITLIDTIDPTITCPADQTVSADANCEFTMADYTGMVTVTDNCDSSVDVVQSPAAGNIVSGTTTVTMTATDNVGNVSTCTFEVIVEDNAAPTIVDCQTDVDRSLNADCDYVLEDFTGAITATDNCTLDADLIYTQSPVAGTILNGVDAVHTITLTATDANGNSTDCSFDITLEDTTAPAIACPAGFNESTDASCEFMIPDYTGLATASDNCDAGVVITQSPAVGTVLSGEGTIQVIVLTATDASGNSTDCSFAITLIDDIDPTITCPADFDVATDVNCEFSIPDYTSLGTAADNCDADVAITQSPAVGNVLSGEGTTQTITLTATDNAGNTSTCSFVITLIDDIDPQITCPGDQNEPVDVNCEFSIPDYTSLAVATDNCDTAVEVTQSPVAGTPLSGEGTTQLITLTATDNAGNTTTCTFDITLIDTIDPTITCPGDQTVSADANCEFTMADYTGMVTATDNCDSSVDVVQSPAAGEIVSGTSTVTVTATDNAGNISTCTFDVIVVDTTDPVFDSCAPDVTELVDASCEFALPDYTVAAVTSDNCDTDIEVTQSPTVGAVFSGHGNVIPVTLTATDDNGNSTTCTFEVTLEDDIAPAITCPASFTVDGDANCEFSIPDYTGMATVSDNCDSNPVVTQSPAEGTILAGEDNVQVITLTATDAAGNQSSCSFTITLMDVIAPSITCPGDIVENVNEFCVFELPDYTGLAVTADNCDSDVEVTQSPAAGTIISASGTVQEITLTATDNSGNQTSCTFDVTLDDVIAPTITCPANQTEEVDNACVFEIPDYSTMATIDDNCGTFTVDQSPAIGTDVTLGTHEITLTVTDPDGNSTDCTFEIEVIDAIDPVVTCIADITVQLDETCGYEVEDFTAATTVTDNCSSIFEVVQSPAAGTIITTDTVMTVTATDEAGNFSSCTFNITLQDTINPVITCPDNIVVTTDPGECGAVVDYELPVITDNCDDLTLELIAGLDPGEFFDQGVTTNTYLVTDGFGNTAECSFTVTVNDEEAPSIACPPSLVLENDSSFCGAIVEYDLPVVDDNCGIDTLVMTDGIASGEFFPEGLTLVEYEVTDIHGNTSVCSFTVRVDDAEAPIIEACPADIVMSNDTGDCGALVTYDLPVATDNCAIDTIQVVSGPESGEYFEVGTTTVSYQVTDESGNSSFCEFTVTIEDTELPVITCPADIEVENDNGICGAVVEYDLPEFSDNCEGSGIELIAGLDSDEEFPVGETTVTYEVTDAAGNTSECSFTVTVLDTEAPVIECQGDIVQEEEVVLYNLPVFSDNCGAEITLIEGFESGEEFPHGYTTVTYEAVDEAGNATSCSFTVLVNTPPIAVDDEVNFYEEDDIIDIDALINDWDPDDDDLTITDITAQHGDVGINADGTIYYDPQGFCGDIDTLTYIACDPFGACDTAMIFVEVECFIDIIIPEGFSPNNDGVNDTFEILGLEDYPGHSIKIFNRWGRKVFEAAPYNSDWDGRAMFGNTGDKELPKGTYFYLLDLANGEAPIKGYIFLNK